MARITIEDCKKEIPNRFELVVLAAQRAKGISSGDRSIIAPSTTSSVSIIALKEIATGNLDIDKLRDSFISSLQESNINTEDAETKYMDVALIGNDQIQNEKIYDTDYDFSDLNLDNNFSDILLGED